MVLLGLNANTACSQQMYKDANVEDFAKLTDSAGVQILDVRTAEEYVAGHLSDAGTAPFGRRSPGGRGCGVCR